MFDVKLPHNWKIAPVDKEISEVLLKGGIPPLLVPLLVRRGVNSVIEAEAFLNPSIEHLHPSDKLTGMAEGVARLLKAIDRQEQILIYGDYDVDGTTAAALLYQVLDRLGAQVEVYLPHRLQEGYGLHLTPLISRENVPSLVVTVDCGIRGNEVICQAAEKGIDVIVTDHHEPEEIPPAIAVINPKLEGSVYPWRELAGVGVAYKLAENLAVSSNFPEAAEGLLDLVALGTIADVVPLLGENRTLTYLGLQAMNSVCRPGIAALRQVAGKSGDITVGEIAFQIAPRLNAAGRLGDAGLSLQLLLADNISEALPIAERLNSENSRRKTLQEQVVKEACNQLEGNPALTRGAIVLYGENWHPGVIGIAASKLVELYHRPVILIALEGDTGKGSGRSLADFPLHAALEKNNQLLDRYGGHAMAAGLSIQRKNIPELRDAVQNLACDILGPNGQAPILELEGKLHAEAINPEGLQELNKLGPFGMGNPRPVFYMGSWLCSRRRNAGSRKEHLIMDIEKNGAKLSGLFFNAHVPDVPLTGRKMLLAGSIQMDNIREGVCVNIREMVLGDIERAGGLLVINAVNLPEKLRLEYLKELSQEKIVVLVNMAASGEKLKQCSYLQNIEIIHQVQLEKRFSAKHLVLWDMPLMPDVLSALLSLFPKELTVHLLFNKNSLADNEALLKATIPQPDTLFLVYKGLQSGLKGQELQSFVQNHLGQKISYALVDRSILILEEAGTISETAAAAEEPLDVKLQNSAEFTLLAKKITDSRYFQKQLMENSVEIIVKVYNTLK